MMSQTDVAATAARQATGDEPVPPQAEIAAKHPAMRAVEAFAEALIVLALLGELLLVLANVFARVYLQRSFLWSDEVARLSLSILAFIGGAVAYRRRDHAFVRVLLDRAAPALERACLVLADIIVLFVVGLVGFASLQFIASSWGERTPVLQLQRH
jgi:TRAP-type C4-dicarboxylate transport system permease small subunit